METKTHQQTGGGVAGSTINESTFTSALSDLFANQTAIRKNLAEKLHVPESQINIKPLGGNGGWEFSVAGNQGAPFTCRLVPSFGGVSGGQR